jgi:hypothetical protein
MSSASTSTRKPSGGGEILVRRIGLEQLAFVD